MEPALSPFAHPFPWVVLVSLWLGAALSRAARRAPRGRGGGEMLIPVRSGKRTAVILYLAFAVVCGLAALLFVGPAGLADVRVLYLLAAATALFFLAFRFKRTAGVATVVLAAALVVVALLFVQSLTAFTGETEIGRVRVLDTAGDRMLLTVAPAEGPPFTRLMDGTYFAPVVRVVIFDDWLVFLGAKTWYRFEGISSFATEVRNGEWVFRQQETDHYFADVPGFSERLWSWYERHEGSVPGVRTVQVEMDLKRALPRTTYSLRVQNDGGLQILELGRARSLDR